ncbi:tRNA (adenosine(37)-N6)-threonylcarbamoyltransferase complex ATPase subunit type 1 TsaE [Candidatus Saccharibacteria bacterium]|nr:tRNA (adenosine(37)-N6)-threonylcarbamoyltransferase complex ATPase subunit type 1 TsaE [Candidatus Saccharibacteria bacterium]
MIDFGRNFAANLSAPAVIELIGDVGAGKTTFTRGLAAGLGVEEPISSPSFTISRFYQGEKYTLTHYDFYRLDDPGLMADDLAESIGDQNNITVIEWGESIADILPAEHYRISIRYIDENTREVNVE